MTNQLFIDDTYDRIKSVISNFDDNILQDIYAISFFKSNQDDDPRHPLLTVGYNTISRWTECTPKPGQEAEWPIASDREEAKWNFAFWLQNEELVIGGQNYDPVSDWVKGLSYYYTDEQEEKDFDKTFLLGEEIQKKFINIIIEHAKKLHESGVIIEKFGRQVPIIIHELEYHEIPVNWTKQANPEGLTIEFEDWVNSM
jgi:hypothetical protein